MAVVVVISQKLAEMSLIENSNSVPRTFLLKSTSPEPKSYECYDQKRPLKVTKITSKKAQNNGINTSCYKIFLGKLKIRDFLGENSSFLRQN